MTTAETGLGRGAVVDDLGLTAELVARALARLGFLRPRASRGWRTAAEYDRLLPLAGHLVDRAGFYAATCCAIEKAVLHCRTSPDVSSS